MNDNGDAVQQTADGGSKVTSGSEGSSQVKQVRPKPRKSLPTTRVTFTKQLKCLLSYGLESRSGEASVRIEQVAKAVGIHPSTVSLCNPFFADVGLLHKTGRGIFLPSSEVLAMASAHGWDEVRAPEKLAPLLRNSWAAQALEPKARLNPINIDDGIQLLAESIGAAPEHKQGISMVLDYLEAARVISRQDGKLSWVTSSSGEGSGTLEQEDRKLPDVVNPDPLDQARPGIPASPHTSIPGSGGISFTVSLQIDTMQIASWTPERIKAFFEGLSTVLSAQGSGGEGGK